MPGAVGEPDDGERRDLDAQDAVGGHPQGVCDGGADHERTWTILGQRLALQPPASASEITETERQLGLQLPSDYLEFIERSNGGEGFAAGWGPRGVAEPAVQVAGVDVGQ